MLAVGRQDVEAPSETIQPEGSATSEENQWSCCPPKLTPQRLTKNRLTLHVSTARRCHQFRPSFYLQRLPHVYTKVQSAHMWGFKDNCWLEYNVKKICCILSVGFWQTFSLDIQEPRFTDGSLLTFERALPYLREMSDEYQLLIDIVN